MLEIALGDQGYDVRSASDGPGGLELARSWTPELIVLDVMLPKIDGVSLLPMFRRVTEAPILMLSAKAEVDDKVLGLARGADDYLGKPFEMSELLARVEAALRRPKLSAPQTLHYADLEVDLETRSVRRGTKQIELSAREFDLLVTLLRHPLRVFSRDQLLDLVWGSERDVGYSAVETYISYLRSKVDQGFDSRLIQTHRGAGYSLRLVS